LTGGTFVITALFGGVAGVSGGTRSPQATLRREAV